LFGPAMPAKWVLAKSIIEKLPMMAPMRPTMSAGSIRNFCTMSLPSISKG
jgi:hypothetical protein